MKKLLLILLAIHTSLFTFHSYSQSCLPEGIVFETQAQIDSFQINYPGCTEIEGNVKISGDDIMNLNGLSVLTNIGGELYIYINPLTSLLGLDNLESIGSHLKIWGNPLTNLSGLENLTSIEGNLDIYANHELVNLTGIENLNNIGGELKVIENSSLLNLTGLESVNSIPGNVFIGIINQGGNESLSSLTGLDSVTSIGGTLRIEQNDALSSIEGLGNVTSIGGDLYIYSNNLSTLSGLDNVNTIGGQIRIEENNLGSIEAFENITSIGGSLHLGGAWSSNTALTSLTGLDNVVTIGGSLTIDGMNSLTCLTGLDNVTSIGGNLEVWRNYALTTFSGLGNLDEIGGNLEIGGWFYYYFRGNPSLISLEELNSLTSIGGSLIVFDNDSLPSFSGLDNINASTIQNITIGGNPLLSTCEVQSICDYLAAPNGDIEIGYNASGCNNQQEVEEACEGLCPQNTVFLTTQAKIDSFPILYPDCYAVDFSILISGPDIVNLNGLGNLYYIESLSIGIYDEGCPNLINLNGLDNLASVGSIHISNNENLQSLSGLDNLNTCYNLGISNNTMLEDLTALNIQNSNISISISNNDAMTSLPDLTGVDTISSNLTIKDNEALLSLSGLDSIRSIKKFITWGGSLQISNNDALVNLSGLEGLTLIEDGIDNPASINITENDALTSLMGLENFDWSSVGFDIIISNNPLLSICSIESVCEYLSTTGNSIGFSNNNTGCNTQEEVEEACDEAFVNEIDIINDFSIFPNPFYNTINIEFDLRKTETVTIIIYNYLNQLVGLITHNRSVGQQKIELDWTDLPAGVYFCVLKTSGGIQTTKMIKL